MDITEKFNELMKDHRMYHTKLQRDYFITEMSGVTIYGKYIQAIREMYSKYKTIKNNQYELSKLEVDIDEIRYKLGIEKDKFELRRLELELSNSLSNKEDIEYMMIEMSKELEHFFKQALFLKEKLGDLSDDRKDELDREFWITKLKRDIAINHLSGRGIDKGVVEIIMSLPKDIRKELIDCAKNPSKAIEYFENKDTDVDKNMLLECDINLLIGQ